MTPACPDPSGEQPLRSPLPPRLTEIVEFFEMLPEPEKRTNLIAYASQLENCKPPDGVAMDLADVRKDEECADTVGIFLKFEGDADRVRYYLTIGDKAQTLTKALGSILCDGMSGLTIDEIIALPPDFIPRIVGTQLFRQRSQTIYYVLTRMKNAAKAWSNRATRQRIEAARGAEG